MAACITCVTFCEFVNDKYTRDDREWLYTFLFPPIPTWSIPILSHSHSQFLNQLPFPWDSHLAIPIPSHSQTIVHELVSESNILTVEQNCQTKAYFYIQLRLVLLPEIPMGIYSYGNRGHSHSHTGWFPFLSNPFHIVSSIPILMGFPWDSQWEWDSHSHDHL